MRAYTLLVAAGLASWSCADEPPSTSSRAGETAEASAHASVAIVASSPSASASVAPVITAVASSTLAAASSAALPGKTEGCPEGMVLNEGPYCPALTQNCLDHHTEYDAAKDARKTVSERCLLYEEPSRCVSKKRRPMRFCMDRYEFPNRVGELPRVLTSWRSAKKLCEKEGKRLCTEDEFNFACEGPEMRPYVYGYRRDPTVCNFDKPYRYPDHSRQMLEYDECLADAACKAELERLDQRERIGDRTTCVSWAGVFDLNGNANEWVELPGEKPPNRSGLKGGWWGPIRARCRPTVTFHKESDYGYEAGFRCCADARSP